MQNPAANLTTPAQQQSVDSLRSLDGGGLFVMDYTADYRLDDLLTADVTDMPALTRFVRNNLLTGGAPAAGTPDAGGGAFFAKRAGGGCLCGRSFDRRTDAPAVLLRTRPEGAYASLALADAYMAGYGPRSLSDGETDLSMTVALPYLAMDGVNERGLFASLLSGDGAPVRQSTGKPAAMANTLLRLALDRAGAVGEAVALLAAYDMHGAADGGFRFLFADAMGRSAMIEYTDGRMRVLDTADGFCAGASIPQDGADSRRQALLGAALDCRDGCLTRTDAMALLRLLRQDGPRFTQWSAVYDLTDRALDVAVRRDYTRVFHVSLYGTLDSMWT